MPDRSARLRGDRGLPLLPAGLANSPLAAIGLAVRGLPVMRAHAGRRSGRLKAAPGHATRRPAPGRHRLGDPAGIAIRREGHADDQGAHRGERNTGPSQARHTAADIRRSLAGACGAAYHLHQAP